MKKILILLVISIMAFGCATAKTDVTKNNPAENATPPAAPSNPEPAGTVTPPAAPLAPETPAAPATGSDAKKMYMDVTDMSSASHNTIAEQEDPNAVKYPGVSIPNMTKKEKLNNAFIRSGKGEVDTNPYSEAGVKPENSTKSNENKNDYGISSPAKKETQNKIMLKTDAITNPKDENISINSSVNNDDTRKTEKKGLVTDYKEVVGVKNMVKKEMNDRISVKTGRDVTQENPVGTASGNKGSASKFNGVMINNPVKKTTNSYINTKTKGVGLWE